jgi:acyl carrier protein
MNNKFTFENISNWLKSAIAKELECEPDAVLVNKSFPSFGLDSVVVVTITVDLENWIGYELEPTIFYEFSSIEELTNWLLSDFLPTQIT